MMCAGHLSRTASPGLGRSLCPPPHLDEGQEASFSGLLLLLADALSPFRNSQPAGQTGGQTRRKRRCNYSKRRWSPLLLSSQFKWRHEISSGEEDLETVLSEDGAEEAGVGHGG